MITRTMTAPLMFALAALLLISACKDKKITGPDDPGGTYRLELRANDTLRYFVNNENIITIRVYQGNVVPTGVVIKYDIESASGYIDDNDRDIIAQSDTNAFPCGANPCMDYHCDDTTVAKDAVFAYAVKNGDTVANAQIGFFLKR